MTRRKNKGTVLAGLRPLRRCGVFIFLAILLLLTLLPVGSAYAAEQALLELKIQVGSTTAVINGKPVVIPKPFTENGTVMVPLGIFKKPSAAPSPWKPVMLLKLTMVRIRER